MNSKSYPKADNKDEDLEVNEKATKGIPPCPPMSPELGDKTPEVMAWKAKYEPESK